MSFLGVKVGEALGVNGLADVFKATVAVFRATVIADASWAIIGLGFFERTAA